MTGRFDNWIAALKTLRSVRKIRAESPFLRALHKRLAARLESSRCLVIGSAAGVRVPTLNTDDRCICINGSPFAAKGLGLENPDLTVISGYTTALKSEKSQATIPILKDLRTQEVLFVETGDTNDHARTVLDGAGFHYERFTKISKHERAAIIGEVCGIELGLGDHNERVSNGMFAATIAAWSGAAEIIMCGFSLKGGHSYIEGDTPRHNLSGDLAFFAVAKKIGIGIKTTSLEIHQACGIPFAD